MRAHADTAGPRNGKARHHRARAVKFARATADTTTEDTALTGGRRQRSDTVTGPLDARSDDAPVPDVAPGTAAPRRRFGRGRLGERGAALVEMALVLPLLLMVVFGIIEFGTTYSNYIGLRDGVRNAARSGAVGNFGQSSFCGLEDADEASVAVQRLMCLTKRQTGLDPDEVRVKIMSANSTFTGAGTFAKNDALIICAQVPTQAVTGFLGTALAGKTLRTKVAMRIERSDIEAVAGEETPPAGQSWSWCTYQALAL